MTQTFDIKEGDTQPSLKAVLKDANRQPRNLSNVSEVTFHMKHVSTQETVIDDSPATIVNAGDGEVVYEWQSGDTDVTGRHEAEFEVTYDSGDKETFPNNDHIEVYVAEAIA